MANNRIQIKRSATTATPSLLLPGELAFSNAIGGSGVLFIGDTSNTGIVAIGGVRYPGNLTANQALVANATSGIDKVIVANLVPTSIWANGSSGTAGQLLTSNSSAVYWSTPAASVAGSDTQVQFNDGGNLAGESGLTFNKTTDTLTSGNLVVSGTTTSSNTTTGALKVAGGVGVAGRINTGDLAAGNDSVYSTLTGTTLTTVNVFATSTVNASTLSVGAWVVANNSGVFTSGVVNGDIIRVGNNFIANTTRVTVGSGVGFSANGSLGTANQVLRSNGSSIYWSDDVGDISSIVANNGLTGGGTSGDVALSVLANNGIVSNSSGVFAAAANGISVTAAGINVLAGNNQLVSNTTGVWVDQTKIDHNSLSNYDANRHVDHTAVSITAGNGLTGGGTIAATRTLTAVGANGISVTAAGINVLAGNSGVISNASGVFVNAATFSIATSQLSGDVALGTQTSGNYVATVAAGNGMVVAGSGSETAAVTVSVLANTGVVANSTGIFIGQPVSTTSNVTFANVVTTLLTVSGNTNLGDATSDVVSFNARVNTSIVPASNQAYDLGANLLRWGSIFVNNITTTDFASFGGNVSIGGTLTVTGNVITTNVQSVIVSDPMIYLAGNNYTSDLLDIGFAANYNDGVTNRHTGLFRDHDDKIWKFFENLTQELSGNNDINVADASYRTATLQTYLNSSALVTNATSVYVTANSTVNVNISANVISLSGRANNDLLFANSTGGITGLALNTTGGYVLQTNGTAIVYDYLDGGTF